MSLFKLMGFDLVLSKIGGFIIWMVVAMFVFSLKKYHPLLPAAVFALISILALVYVLKVKSDPKLTEEEKRYKLTGKHY